MICFVRPWPNEAHIPRTPLLVTSSYDPPSPSPSTLSAAFVLDNDLSRNFLGAILTRDARTIAAALAVVCMQALALCRGLCTVFELWLELMLEL